MALDLVQIGFEVEAKGLEEANRKIDKLIDKFSRAGDAGELAAETIGKAQDKAAKAANKSEKEILSSTDKILKKQQLMGEFLPYYNKSTSGLLANFRLMEKDTSKLRDLLEQVYKNDAIESYKKQQSQLIKQQEQQAKIVKDTTAKFDNLSQKSFGGGILDTIGKQNSGLAALRKQYQQLEKEQDKNAKQVANIVDKYEGLSRKSFGGGILDTIDQQSNGMKDLVNQFKSLENADKQYTDSVEKNRQREMQARQNEYQKNMELLEQQRVAEMKARQASYTKSISSGSPMTSGTSNVFGDPVNKTSNSLGTLESSSKKAEKSYGSLLGTLGNIAKFAILSTAIYAVINSLQTLTTSFITTADEMQNLNQRISLYTPNGIKLNDVMERLGTIATQNRVTLADTGKLYTQLLPPIQRLKGSTDQTLAVVDAFGKAMLVGGANTREAAAATVQFGQAMASGKLAGDEFRSLAEASPRLLQAIAEGSGIAAQKLKEMSAAGKLTSGLVSSALLDQFIQLQLEAAKMGTTVSAALNEGTVAYQQFVDEFNKQTGLTEGLVELIRGLVASAKSFGDSLLKSLKDSNSTLNSFLGMLKTVWDLVGAIVSGFSDTIGWLIQGGEKIGLWKAIFDSVKLAVIAIVDTLLKIPFVIVNIGTNIAELVLKPFEKFIDLAARGLSLAGFAESAQFLNEKLKGYHDTMGAIKGTTGEVISGTNLLSLGVKKAADNAGNFKTVYAGLTGQLASLNEQEKKSAALSDKKRIDEYVALKAKEAGVVAGTKEYELIRSAVTELYNKTQEMSKQLKLQGDIQAKEDAAAKAREKYNKESKSARDSYEDQVMYVQRLQNLLASGVDFTVAKIAAEKEYATFIKDTGLAQNIVMKQQALSRLEYESSLKTELAQQDVIVGLMKKHVDYETAKALAQEEYVANTEAVQIAALKLANEIYAQQQATADQVTTQKAINRHLKDGVDLETAKLRVTIERIEALEGEKGNHTAAKRQLEADIQRLKLAKVEADTRIKINDTLRSAAILNDEIAMSVDRGAYASAKLMVATDGLAKADAFALVQATDKLNLATEELNTKLQLNSLLSTESAMIKDIRDTYPTISEEALHRLEAERQILDVAKKYSEQKERDKKNPLGDFSNVDFSAFGDFGNPFESALNGLNEFLYQSSEIEDRYNNMFDSIRQNIAKANKDRKSTAEFEAQRAVLLTQYEEEKAKTREAGYSKGLKFAKGFFKEESKGYKIITALEMALQAKKIAMAIWEKKDYIATLGMKIIGYAQDAAAFVMGSTTKIAAQSAQNVVQAQGAVASAANAPFPVGFAAAAAMIALLAGVGIALGGGGSSGSYASFENKGTGTVFGDPEAESKSIQNSIELLADNSDVMLPLTNAMLKSLRNIENNIGGLTNLLIRNAPAEGLAAGLGSDWKLGSFSQMSVKVTEGVVDFLTLGLDKLLLGGAIGNLLGGIVGTIMGGLFGKTKSEVTASGLFGANQELGNILENGFQLKEYADVKTTKKSWFSSSTSYSTKFAKANPELERQFTLIFSNIYNSMMSATNALGFDLDKVASKLSDHVVKLGKINLKGLKGEEIQERLTAVFGAASDEIARAATNEVKYITTQVQVPVKSLFGRLTGKTKTITQTQAVITNVFDDFQKVGEGFFETIVRVATGVEQAAKLTDRLFVSSIDYRDIINKQGDVATEIVRQSVLLAEGMKGIEGGFYDLVDTFDGTASELVDFILTLRDLQDAVYATGKNGDYLTSSMFAGAGGLSRLQDGLDTYFEMMSPMEQATELTRRMTNEFAKLGLQLPSDIKAYRNLVSSIDISSSAGQKLYGQVIALAPEFMDLQDSLETARDSVNELVKSLRDLAEEARKARGETQQPRNLASIRSEFDSTAALAMQGDMTAAQKLLTLGKDLMQVSKQYSVSSSEYAKDLATIQKVATVSADVQELGLGYTPTTSLTPLASAGTQTVETVNSTTDAKLEALRADLITAITAVAKYTQDTAQRLQRWDYGDKMNVHVEQEVGDAPIKVQTV